MNILACILAICYSIWAGILNPLPTVGQPGQHILKQEARRDIDNEGAAGTDGREMLSETLTASCPALCHYLQMDFFLLAHSHSPERYYPPTPLHQESVPASNTFFSSPFTDASLGVLGSTSWSSSANFRRLL
ncbi:hypothetical protein EDD85DRAFT_353631 [Armillaria nabsnona]|nr:hypothetical protein EDD85DRAFT_353631 [Armillaria nabsnona]